MPPAPQVSRSNESPLARCEVLIIDGSTQYTAALQQQLALVKVQRVQVATSATEAMQAMGRRHHDIVLCDYSLGCEAGGLYLLEAARSQGCLAVTTGFVLMVSHPSSRIVAECRDREVDSLMIKPTTVNVLQERMLELLDRQATFSAARQMAALGDIDGALAAYDLIANEAGRWSALAHQLRARMLVQAGRAGQAATMYEAILASEPKAGWARLGLARAHQACGDHDLARKVAREVLARHKADQHVEAFDILASSMDEQGDGVAGIKVLHDAVAIMPSPGRLRRLGEMAYRHRQLETARQSYDRLVRTTRGTPLARDIDTLSLAQVEVDLEQVGSALRTTDAVLRNVPPHGDLAGAARALRAQAFARLRKPREAREALHQAREAHIEPSPELPTMALAKAELMTGSEAEGIRLLQGAFAARPSHPVRQTVDNMLVDTQRQHMAGHVFEHVRAIELINASMTAFREDRIEDGLATIHRALKEFPANSEVLITATKLNCIALGVSKHYHPQREQQASACMRRLQEMLPDNREVRRMAGYYRDTMDAIGRT